MDTIEQMQHEIDELKKEVQRLKREAGNVQSQNYAKINRMQRLIDWQRINLNGMIMDYFDQYDEENHMNQ